MRAFNRPERQAPAGAHAPHVTSAPLRRLSPPRGGPPGTRRARSAPGRALDAGGGAGNARAAPATPGTAPAMPGPRPGLKTTGAAKPPPIAMRPWRRPARADHAPPPPGLRAASTPAYGSAGPPRAGLRGRRRNARARPWAAAVATLESARRRAEQGTPAHRASGGQGRAGARAGRRPAGQRVRVARGAGRAAPRRFMRGRRSRPIERAARPCADGRARRQASARSTATPRRASLPSRRGAAISISPQAGTPVGTLSAHSPKRLPARVLRSAIRLRSR
ncbi:hypothetical protein SAMN05216200_10594 [Oceanicella actignis]|uniref:Uncharacterized protein n=1 Tax=Oceanicella actignis TaxID=1189325 RepID=A0A1M7T9B2_9RHOB|nr:hypothetical protein SAMN04488119_10595 [Oceanicella actignis]SHN67306.1 hypothetical protein SAMN05216200_10594 [Oceanicella actignis]